MEAIPAEVAALLKQVRAHLANSGDPWERRRELIVAINQHVEGGEADLFVGTVREMSRIGTTYANLMQTLAQMNTGPEAAARLGQLMAGTMPTAAFLMPGAFNPIAGLGLGAAGQPAFPANAFAAPFAAAPATATANAGGAPPLPGMDYFRMVTDFMNAQATSLKAASAAASGSSEAAAQTPRE